MSYKPNAESWCHRIVMVGPPAEIKRTVELWKVETGKINPDGSIADGFDTRPRADLQLPVPYQVEFAAIEPHALEINFCAPEFDFEKSAMPVAFGLTVIWQFWGVGEWGPGYVDRLGHAHQFAIIEESENDIRWVEYTRIDGKWTRQESGQLF